ncbi:hypothetical protein Trihar35433_1056 [Trichoderma harzianum]|nr:hypothetical protein Trihar35433_1056 [Trichoderma harzianum]
MVGWVGEKEAPGQSRRRIAFCFSTHSSFCETSDPQTSTLNPAQSTGQILLPAGANSDHDERCCCEAAGGLSEGGFEEDEIPEIVAAVHGDRGCEPLHPQNGLQSETAYGTLYMEQQKVAKFQIWPQVPSPRATHPDPMPALKQQEIARLDPTGARTRLFSREHADSAKVGDVLMVTTKAGEPFSGAFIQLRRRGVDTAILLRGQMMKVGVEMWFKIYSPTVTGIDIIWRKPKRARRARLTFMRKPKHDMGSVDNLVSAWKKERYALRSKAKQGGGRQVR